jgi:hypothetical protein
MSFQESAADDGRAFLQVMPRYFLRPPLCGRGLVTLRVVSRQLTSVVYLLLGYYHRRTWGMQDVSDQFCSWDEASSSCNWIDYAQSISLVAFPSFVVGTT